MKKIIIANWKMNPEKISKAKNLFNSLKKGIKRLSHFVKKTEIVICPPFVYLPLFSPNSKKNPFFKLGAQDCFWEEKGAFTGEISALMLKDLGCQYVIVGHSERRALGENEEMINKKLKAVLNKKMKPILCIGETLKERKANNTFQVLENQLRKSFLNLGSKASNVIVAYEPVWAIGTGLACEVPKAKEVLIWLKKFLAKNQVIYGGSVNSKNALNYIEIGFNGLLVGGASLKPKEFLGIVKKVGKC